MNQQSRSAAHDETILSVERVTKTYQGVVAVDDISLSFRRGEVHAIVGENGAGKSTLIKLLSGFTTPDRGSFTIDGHSFQQITPRQAMDEGIGVIYQEPNLVRNVSVAENVFLGNYLGNGLLINRPLMEQRTREIFAELNLLVDPREIVDNLGAAQMQFVEIAKAVVRDVKVLILDEPTAPLTTQDAQVLFRLVARLKEKGVTIIYISHRFGDIYALSDRLTVMRDGKVVTTAETREVPQDHLIYLMVGRHLSESYPPRSQAPGAVVLRVQGLSRANVQDVSFSLRRGEILGLAGLTGSGRTETVRMIFGADKKTAGEIELNGRRVNIDSPQAAVRMGIGYLPEDRKHHGLLMSLSIRENMSLPILRRLSRCLMLNRRREEDVVNRYSGVLRIKAPSLLQPVCNLSGGNQQKVVVSKWLATDCSILIFDEPTQGIDVGTKFEIYQMMNRLTEQGISIIMVSSEMEELIGMADRILVLHEGQLTGVLEERSQFTQERIMELASRAKEGGATSWLAS